MAQRSTKSEVVKHRRTQASKAKQYRVLQIQSLEKREVPAIALIGAEVTVTAGDFNDAVLISTQVVNGQSMITARRTETRTTPLGTTVFNESQSFPAARVSSVRATLGNGTNSFTNSTSLPSIAIGGTGIDTMNGGPGKDIFTGMAGPDRLFGNGGPDTLVGGAGADRLAGGDGDDILLGGDDADDIDGGRGNDQINGEAGGDSLFGGLGSDTLFGGTGDDVISGGEQVKSGQLDGDDTISGGDGNDKISGREGNDTISGGNGNDLILAHEGNDTISGGDGNDTLEGGEGNDSISGNGGNDEMFGNEGSDELFGGDGDDTMDGGDGNDSLEGGAGDDQISAGLGDDTVLAGTGRDRVFGEGGDDLIDGEAGDDWLDGGADDDEIHGGDNNDHIYGSIGEDKIFGEQGNDTLAGGDQVDLIVGGNGVDTIVAIDGNADVIFAGVGVTTTERDELWFDGQDRVANSIAIGSVQAIDPKAVHLVQGYRKYKVDGVSISTPISLHTNLVDPKPREVDTLLFNVRKTDLPLFGSTGPHFTDVDQGAVGSCYFLARLASLAKTHPQYIRDMVADLGDGTYAVQFFFQNGSKTYVRVDNSFYANTETGPLKYANLTAEGALWVAVIEKAWAIHRYATASYDDISGGNSEQTNTSVALGLNQTDVMTSSVPSPLTFVNIIQGALNAGRTVLIPAPANLSNDTPMTLENKQRGTHVYMVHSVWTNAQGTPNKVLLYNLYGDPLIEITNLNMLHWCAAKIAVAWPK